MLDICLLMNHLRNYLIRAWCVKYSEKSGLVEKMSKSKGNVVNPDEIVQVYGSDVLRMYMLFMGPPELDCEWQDDGLEGIKRFANRFINYIEQPSTMLAADQQEDIKVTKVNT